MSQCCGGKLLVQKKELSNVLVLVDLGASTSFIDESFVLQNRLKIKELDFSAPMLHQCCSSPQAHLGLA